MDVKIQEFASFVRDVTGACPECIASFANIFICIPKDKKPPLRRFDYFENVSSLIPCTSKLNKQVNRQISQNHWEMLATHLGPRLYRFCMEECIFLEGLKSGAYMVSNIEPITAMLDTSYRKTLNFQNEMQLYDINVRVRKRKNSSVHKDDCTGTANVPSSREDFLDSINFHISSDHLLGNTSQSSSPFTTRILLTNSSAKLLAIHVLVGPQLGSKIIDCYTNLVKPLEILLMQMQKSYRKFRRDIELNTLILSNPVKPNSRESKSVKHTNQLSISLLTKYFNRILVRIVPHDFFGCHRNRNIVLRYIVDLLESPRFKPIDLKPCLLSLKIAEIQWLKCFEDNGVQQQILARWLIWLFNDFIMEIIRTELYVLAPFSYRKLYFKNSDWMALSKTFLGSRISNGSIIKIPQTVELQSVRVLNWTLVPKKDTARPVMSQKATSNEMRRLRKNAGIFLQQLCSMHYKSTTMEIFYEKWKELVQKYRDIDKQKLYVVSCDIEDAYGSINQKKLLKIVDSLAEDAGPILDLRTHKVLKRSHKFENYYWSKMFYYTNPELQLPVSKNHIISKSYGQTTRIKKDTLVQEIYASVQSQMVRIVGNTYLLGRGISQGGSLSPVLCDLYYGRMIEEHLKEFENDGCLLRYVDDILFVTTDELLAERFLQLVEGGFKDYNCKFNREKTHTNIRTCKNPANVISYLGFQIDIDSMQVTPHFSELSRYTMSFALLKDKTDPKILRMRLQNFTSLKLSKISLDSEINSNGVILRNVSLAFTRQAERCLCILQYTSINVSQRVNHIFNVIQSTNSELCQYVRHHLRRSQSTLRTLQENEENYHNLCRQISFLVWQSYIEVFGKVQHIFSHFREQLYEVRALALKRLAIIQNYR